MCEYGKGEWLGRKLLLVFAAALGAAAFLMATASPLAAKKNVKEPKKMAEVFPDPDNGEPLTLHRFTQRSATRPLPRPYSHREVKSVNRHARVSYQRRRVQHS